MFPAVLAASLLGVRVAGGGGHAHGRGARRWCAASACMLGAFHARNACIACVPHVCVCCVLYVLWSCRELEVAERELASRIRAHDAAEAQAAKVGARQQDAQAFIQMAQKTVTKLKTRPPRWVPGSKIHRPASKWHEKQSQNRSPGRQGGCWAARCTGLPLNSAKTSPKDAAQKMLNSCPQFFVAPRRVPQAVHALWWTCSWACSLELASLGRAPLLNAHQHHTCSCHAVALPSPCSRAGVRCPAPHSCACTCC